jgi:hypothetical protein
MKARLRRVLEAPGLRWKIAVAVAILSMPALWTGLGGDELLHLALMHGRLGPEVGPFGLFSFLPDEPEVRHRMLDAGVLPWWSSPEIQIAFWRPITSLTHWVDYTLWPNAPALMAAQNVAWYTVVVLLATALFRRVQGVGWVAGLAALLFAVDDAHAVTLGWIAARNTLIGAAAGIGALVAHDRWRRHPCRACRLAREGISGARRLLRSGKAQRRFHGASVAALSVVPRARGRSTGGWLVRVGARPPAALPSTRPPSRRTGVSVVPRARG